MVDNDNLVAVGVRLEAATYERLREIAEKDDRTVSNLLRKWIEERLDRERR
jgi:predicted DNA-binding ribbon-helix-helix protein